jgi:hypothetical protein
MVTFGPHAGSHPMPLRSFFDPQSLEAPTRRHPVTEHEEPERSKRSTEPRRIAHPVTGAHLSLGQNAFR